jgi:hypothetical protein
MFNDLNNNQKLAYAISMTFNAMHNSVVNNNDAILGDASDNFTIMEYVENINADLYEFINTELTDNEYDIYIETVFALYNTFNLYNREVVKLA